ncbi:MAG TPA: hypothetical protein DEP84_18535 [Chloroflexi bacterium]|nr:hypothetical protein [Chloroflexota bacterium]
MAAQVRVALVQPESYRLESEWRNAGQARAYVDEAVARYGAPLVVFPEGYPGPYSGPMDSGGHLDQAPIDGLREKAREHGIYISAGHLEANPDLSDTYFLAHKLIGPSGEVIGHYRRTHPNHPHLNAYLMGGRRHILPGEEIFVVDTDLGGIGLQVCTELFVPEISRIQMLGGADILIAPAGGRYSPWRVNVGEAWEVVTRARALENLVYVLTTQHVWQPGAPAKAFAVGPEGVVAYSREPGIVYATLDLDRLDWLRSHYYNEELMSPPPDVPNFVICRARPGQSHDRRPELYARLVEPQPDAFDYHYARRGLETWAEEYERVREAPRQRRRRHGGESQEVRP